MLGSWKRKYISGDERRVKEKYYTQNGRKVTPYFEILVIYFLTKIFTRNEYEKKKNSMKFYWNFNMGSSILHQFLKLPYHLISPEIRVGWKTTSCICSSSSLQVVDWVEWTCSLTNPKEKS